jgi:HEAT repeat protein
VNNDPEEAVKAQAVFAISQLPDDQSIPILIDLAKTHRSLAVRKKAIFWLGQKNDRRALDAIADMLK